MAIEQDGSELQESNELQLECLQCHAMKRRRGFRDGMCHECDSDRLLRYPKELLAKAVSFLRGGAGVTSDRRVEADRILAGDG